MKIIKMRTLVFKPFGNRNAKVFNKPSKIDDSSFEMASNIAANEQNNQVNVKSDSYFDETKNSI